jgi:hypothetical protein
VPFRTQPWSRIEVLELTDRAFQPSLGAGRAAIRVSS